MLVLTDWKDFPALAAAISAYLPGLRPDWLDVVRGLPAMAGPVTVWERGDSAGAGPD
jgi:hypothetical protein